MVPVFSIFFKSYLTFGCLGCFHVLADVNKAAVNTWVHMFSGCITNSGFAESYSSLIFSFLRNRHNVLHSGCINLQSKCPMTDECIKTVIHTYIYSRISLSH